MLWTLQWYIFREMGKAFLLTAVALTGLIGLGGGVMNMLEAEQVTADQLLRIMTMVLPVAGALTLPVAALFSATLTYGRLSADNEWVACRASGINIHHLFLPTLVFSVVSGLVTFFCVNFVIPGMIANLARLVKADAVRFVQHRLQSPERLPLGGNRYWIYADQSEAVQGRTIGEVKTPDRLALSAVAFVEMAKGNWTRYGTAQRVDIRFDMAAPRPMVDGEMYGLSLYDRGNRQWTQPEYLALEPFPVPQSIPMKLKWRNLSELSRFRRHPTEIPDIKDPLNTVRSAIARAAYYDSIAEEWLGTDGRQLRLGNDRVAYELSSGNLRPDAEDGRPLFVDGVTVREVIDGEVRTLRSGRGTLEVRPVPDGAGGEVTLRLYEGVEIPDRKDPGRSIKKQRVDLEPFPLPQAAIDLAESYSDRFLLAADAGRELHHGPRVRQLQAKLVEEFAGAQRKILALIHSRLAFSASVLVLVILGAALGILFRGAHVLVAFGISFVPSLFVIATVIMGRQLANNPGTTVVGILAMWGGIVLVGALDTVVLAKFVRR
ncbi:MAG: LptF/LptG family permease [Phycisphaerales bacterium]|nr:MAG: LptF/LptG family permease [Phycisphaerales bacterium]